MKDIMITSKRISTELRILLICFLLAFALNIGCIIAYTRPWIEIFTQLGFVVVISLCIYVVITIVRMVFYAIRKLFANKNICQNKSA